MLGVLFYGPLWVKGLIVLGILFAALIALCTVGLIYNLYFHPLRNLPAPAVKSALVGGYPELANKPAGVYLREVCDVLGPTFKGVGFLSRPLVVTLDTAALGYIQTNAYAFVKPDIPTKILGDLIGYGVLMSEGDAHRRQRRVLQPAFAPAAIRDMVPMFHLKALELRDRIQQLIGEPADAKTPAIDNVDGGRKIDVAVVLNQVTFDLIGLAGCDVDFQCLQRPHVVVEGFRAAFAQLLKITPMSILQTIVPVMSRIPTKRMRLVHNSLDTSRRVGRELVERRKRELVGLQGGDAIEKTTDVGKDLLSLIVKANMAHDLPPTERLSDQEMIDQLATFMLAGSETTSNATTWCLFRLAQNLEMQRRLREELLTVHDEEPSLDVLNSLPFFEKVVRESLRLDPPVPEFMREAATDVVLPLATPVRGADGTLITAIPMRKGDHVMISPINANRRKDIWGDDAEIYDPDRFDNEGIPAVKVPGTYGNLLTFYGGARNCVGYRFALAELKVLLYMLIRNFEFEIPPSKPEITQKSFIVMLPWVVGEEDKGPQMPLVVREVVQ